VDGQRIMLRCSGLVNPCLQRVNSRTIKHLDLTHTHRNGGALFGKNVNLMIFTL